MSELQSTIEFSVELFKFYNVDLFQRGMYQVRCSLRVSSKLSVSVEVTTPEVTTGLGTAIVLGNYGACRPFQILYRNEEITLKDVVLFRCHMLVDGNNLRESLERAEFSLILELWFSDTSPVSMVMVSSRTLQLNMSPTEGLHYHLPILFDYFHLSAISLTIHAALTALHQPSMNAPKSSKSWSKIRSTHCSSLTDPVLPVSSNKIYSRINESPQVHLEAYNVLLDSSNNLRTTLKEYKMLLMQKEEIVPEDYDTLIVKYNEYDSTKLIKKRTFVHNSSLGELCAENIKLWNYFLLTFSCKIAIQQYLSKKHHNLRVRRFAELFFLIYNPRRSAFGCYETNYQNYLMIADIARRSKYVQMLPPLPVHCVALDGENTTMPVIFEDQYQNPFDFEKKNCEERSITPNTDSWTLKTSDSIHLDDKNCSCGIRQLWENRNNSDKTLVNVDTSIYGVDDSLNFTIPTRHSKSLDQLQLCTRNNFHYSLSNIRGQGALGIIGLLDKSQCYRLEPTLKNIASEHDMRNRKYFLENELKMKSKSRKGNICNCSLNNCRSLNSVKNAKDYDGNIRKVDDINLDLNNIRGEEEYKLKNIKNLTKVKKQYQSLVKSISQTPSDSSPNIFRTNSMQFFSPKKKISSNVNKYNSLLTRSQSKRKLERLVENNIQIKIMPEKLDKEQDKSKCLLNGTRFEIGSTSSSTESLLVEKLTGSKSKALPRFSGIRRVRSTSYLSEEFLPILSGTESLPNITCQIEDRLYTDMKYYSSFSSSTTSDQSGWISSRSSSIELRTAKLKLDSIPGYVLIFIDYITNSN